MMNGPIVAAACSEHLAAKLLEDDRLTDRDRLERACRSILGRPAAAGGARGVVGVPRALREPRRLWPGKIRSARRRLAWQGLCRACCRPTSLSTWSDDVADRCGAVRMTNQPLWLEPGTRDRSRAGSGSSGWGRDSADSRWRPCWPKSLRRPRTRSRRGRLTSRPR